MSNIAKINGYDVKDSLAREKIAAKQDTLLAGNNITITDNVISATNGISPTAAITKTGNTATITITDVNGTTTAEIHDGTDGAGGSVTVDSDMSDTSTNPVQNKVIKAYTDNAVKSATAPTDEQVSTAVSDYLVANPISGVADDSVDFAKLSKDYLNWYVDGAVISNANDNVSGAIINGVFTANATWYTTDYVPVIAGIDICGLVSSSYVGAWYDNAKKYLRMIKSSEILTDTDGNTYVTVPDDAKYLRACKDRGASMYICVGHTLTQNSYGGQGMPSGINLIDGDIARLSVDFGQVVNLEQMYLKVLYKLGADGSDMTLLVSDAFSSTIIGSAIKKSGALSTNTTWCASDYIPICEGTYTFTNHATGSGTYPVGVFYDSGKNVIGYATETANYIGSTKVATISTVTISGLQCRRVTVPAGACYVRYNAYNNNAVVTADSAVTYLKSHPILRGDITTASSLANYIGQYRYNANYDIMTNYTPNQINAFKSPLDGKKIYCFGDSVTQGQTAANYPAELARLTNAKVTNYGHSGDPSANMRTLVLAKDYTDVDIATLMIGYNNAVTGETLDSSGIKDITDYNSYPASYYGDVCASVEHIMAQNPATRIYLISPAYASSAQYNNRPPAWDKALKEIAGYYHIPMVSLYDMSGINHVTAISLLRDGLHPTDDMYIKLGGIIAKQLCSV